MVREPVVTKHREPTSLHPSGSGSGRHSELAADSGSDRDRLYHHQGHIQTSSSEPCHSKMASITISYKENVSIHVGKPPVSWVVMDRSSLFLATYLNNKTTFRTVVALFLSIYHHGFLGNTVNPPDWRRGHLFSFIRLSVDKDKEWEIILLLESVERKYWLSAVRRSE